MIVLGLTGSIGMGKTLAARQFRSLGIPVYDADKIVHFLLKEDQQVRFLIENEFPDVLVNGKINPALYDIKLPGWKYRGRGAVGVTFKDNYIRAARAGGIDFKELERRIMEVDEENKGKRGAHPLPGDIAIQLSLGYLKTKNSALLDDLELRWSF